MRDHHTLAAMALLPILAAPACGPLTEVVQKDHVQTVVVHTEPQGASVYQRVKGEAIELGQAPVVVRGGYSVLEQRTNPGNCALAGAAEGLSLGDDIGGKAGAIFGLIGLVAGAAAGAAACQAADGPLETYGSQIVLVATKPGYLAEQHVVQIPRDAPNLTLRLIPDPNAPPGPDRPAEAEPASRAPARVPARITLNQAGPGGAAVHRPGLAIYPVQVEVTDGEVADGAADWLTSHLVTALDRAGFIGPDPEAGAELILDTRLLAVGELCLLSATLYQAEDRRALRAASTRGACDIEALDGAIDRLAGQLAPNAEAAVAGQ